MALQSAPFDDTLDPMQRVRRRMVTRLTGTALDPAQGLPAPQTEPVEPADFSGGVAPPNPIQPEPAPIMAGPRQQIPLPEPIPDVPGAGLPTFPQEPPVSIPPPVGLAPGTDITNLPPGSPKITAGPVGQAPLGPTGVPDNTDPNWKPPTWHPVAGYEGDIATGKNYANVPGFDLGKITSGGGSAGKYTPALRAFSQAIQGMSAQDPSALPRVIAYMQANGFPNAKQVGNDKIDAGDGNGPIDVITDVGGQNSDWWFQNGQDRFGGSPAAAPDGSGAGAGNPLAPPAMNAGGKVNPSANHPGTGSTEAEWAISKVLSGEWTQQQADEYLGTSSGGGGGNAGGGGGTSNDFMTQVRAELMKRLAEAGQPVDENAAGISGAVSVARDEATRAAQQERTALAERLAAQGGGLHSNALTQQIQQSGETNARNLSTLRSGMIVKEYARKQQQLTSLLNMALASGDAELARNTQMKLAELQATVQREGLGVDLSKFLAALNQQAVLAGLG